MKSSYLKVLSASIIVALIIILTAFTGDNENNNWKYIGSYSCRYDNYGSNFYQTTIIVEVYYKPYKGGMVTYGVKDYTGNLIEIIVGISEMKIGGSACFHNFRRSKSDIGVVSFKINALPDQYWPQ